MPNKREDRTYMDRIKDSYDSAQEKVIDARDRTKEKIQENPFTSVIIAAAVGAVVGVATAETIRAMRRRNRK